jgi:hypothetical protein
LLRTLLIDACVRRDLGRLRGLLRGYADWLDTHGVDRTLTGPYALATCDNVVLTGTTYEVLDPSWQTADPQPTEVVLARGLRRFAAELLTGGYAHPWPSTLDLFGLSVVLGGLAGHDLEQAVVAAAVELEADVVAAMRDLDPAGRDALVAELRSVTATAPPAGLDSYQELREAWLRQREEVARIEALLRWTEQLLTSREHALKRAQVAVNLLSGSISFRVGRLLIAPARLAKRYLRRVVRRVRRMRTDGRATP